MLLSKKPEIEAFLKAPPAHLRLCLIHGHDRSDVREKSDLFARALVADIDDPFSVSLLTGHDLANDPIRLVDELSALSLMRGRRLVRLRLADAGEKSARSQGDKQMLEKIKAHLDGDYNPEACLLIESAGLDKSSALRKLAESARAAVSLAIYEDDAGDILRLIKERLAKDNLSLTREAMEGFMARLPKVRGILQQEIERLILYLGPNSGRCADLEDLVPFFGVEPETSLFAAAFDAFGARTGEAQAALRRARAEGEAGVPTLRALSLHLMRLRRALLLIGQGKTPQEASKSVGVFWKQEQAFVRQLRSWRLEWLDKLQPEIFEADRMCRTTGSPCDLIAERLVLRISEAAKRCGL